MILKYCTVETLLIDASRVNKAWKSVIDINKNIQHWLYLQPWCEDDYFYRYAKINPFLSRFSYTGDDIREPGCFYDWGPGPDGGSDDEDWHGGDWRADEEFRVYNELNWRKIERDERFMRPEASWRRMLPMLPPPRAIWNYCREAGSVLEDKRTRYSDRSSIMHPTRLGELYTDVLSLEADRCCQRTRTVLRTSERYHIALYINVKFKPIDSEEDALESEQSVFF